MIECNSIGLSKEIIPNRNDTTKTLPSVYESMCFFHAFSTEVVNLRSC